MRVDQHIITAIDQYLQANRLTQKEFARRLGVCEATVVKWHRAGNGVSNVHWRIIYPLIKRYLPQNRIFITNAGEEEYSSLTGEHEIDPKYQPSFVPLLNTDKLKQYNPIVGIEQFAQTEHLDRVAYRPKVAGVGGIFRYDLEFASNGVPAGALLYVSSEAKPKNGSLILAVATNGVVTLGTFSATGTVFELIVDGKKMSGRLDSIRTLFSGFFPVISYEVICF